MTSKIIRRLESFFLKEQFRPTLIGLLINPFYYGRSAIYRNVKKYSEEISGISLDIGCGCKPYAKLFNTNNYIGLDIETTGHDHRHSEIDVYYDGKVIPFSNNFFDSVVSFEVLQLVFNPDMFLDEVFRVMKPGSKGIFTVPFIWDEHEQPYDYARYTSFGLRFLFEKHGFRIVENKKYLKDLRIIPLLFNTYIYKTIRRIIPSRYAMLLILPLTAMLNIIGVVLQFLPNNNDLYFGNIILFKKPEK